MYNAITDVPGIRVGHYTDLEAATGCTVVLCTPGTTGGVDVRGSAPGTRETDLLNPIDLVDQVDAILLSGGSAFGLDAATGVMRYLEEQGQGFDTGVAKVPIVPGAVLFDLAIGSAKIRPNAEAGYAACQAATAGAVAEGCVGAGTGATVGKLLGPKFATKSGLGTASMQCGKGLCVGALVAVNAFGDVVDPQNGEIIAGTRRPVLGGFLNTVEQMKGDLGQTILGFMHTTIGVVATNACLTQSQATKVAQMAHDGLALTIRPVHTMVDGDALFALATGKPGKGVKYGDPTVIGTAAVQVVAQAVLRAVRMATGLAGVPAAGQL